MELRTWFGLILCLVFFSSCRHEEEADELDRTVDYCWDYARKHPDGFTLRIDDFSIPAEGIVVAYAVTQNHFGKEGLRRAVVHSLSHNKLVGGWYNAEDGRYYFDSDTLFLESMLDEAVAWARANSQYAVYVLSTKEYIDTRDGK